MKRIITIALVFAFSGFYAKSAYAAVSVSVPVLCRADGNEDVYIAKMEALDDTLLETIREGLLYLKNTESGDFVMEFTEPGNYHYRVLQDEEASSDKNFDRTAFAVDVYVSRNDDGTLVAEPVVYEVNGSQKETAIRFLNMPKEYYELETEPETDEAEINEAEIIGTETDKAESVPDTQAEPDRDRTGSGTGRGSTSVKTQDQTPVIPFLILLVISGAAAAAFAGRIRRRGKGVCGR